MAKKLITKWIIMKSKHGESNGTAVYSDKFTEYDKAKNLEQWLNRHNGEKWSYWLKEIEEYGY